MWIEAAVGAAIAFLGQPALVQPPAQDMSVIAQAYDRCMATYAVRLTRTAASDADIFAEASRSCASIKERLRAAVIAQLPPAQSAEMLRVVDSHGEANFMAMLLQIRADRIRREALRN